jgi:hypothetical protein
MRRLAARDWLFVLIPLSVVVYLLAFRDQFNAIMKWFVELRE